MRRVFFLLLFFFTHQFLFAQQKEVAVVVNHQPKQQQVSISINGKKVTNFFYADSLYKPFLFPIAAPDGSTVTRGFPIDTRPGEPTDHPHHTGIWLNYESVNGLDFWNNSYAVPTDKKNAYGSIKTSKIIKTASGSKGLLQYEASWQNYLKQTMLTENTGFTFYATNNTYIIDRITTLTAMVDVVFKDVKDGLLGFRVCRSLQLPDTSTRKFTDDKGIVTIVKADSSGIANGNYISSNGKTGNDVWGTRASWCMLYGKINTDIVSLVIVDNPKNPGYPTYWHARGYGLFAANPLGQSVFSNGKETLNLSLKKGEAVTFRYRIIIGSGKEKLANEEIEKLAQSFE